jgi:hypothetical protein
MQVNKNVYLKGRLGADGVALMAAFKSWFQPSLTLAGVIERCFDTGKTRTGVTIQVSKPHRNKSKPLGSLQSGLAALLQRCGMHVRWLPVC